MNSFTIVFTILTVFSGGLGFHLPPEFHTCSRSDLKFAECLRASIEDAIGKLANGNKQLGIIPIEPLGIAMISVGQVPGSSVNIDQKFTDIKLHGLSASKVTKVHADLDNNCLLYAEGMTPTLRIEAEFEIKGELLIFPINGKGPSNVTLTNLKSTHNITCEKYEKKGKERIRAIDYKLTLQPENVHYKFDNVINGANQALSDQIHKVINENSVSVFDEVRPATEESYSLVFKEIGNRIFTKIPFDEIFRD